MKQVSGGTFDLLSAEHNKEFQMQKGKKKNSHSLCADVHRDRDRLSPVVFWYLTERRQGGRKLSVLNSVLEKSERNRSGYYATPGIHYAFILL